MEKIPTQLEGALITISGKTLRLVCGHYGNGRLAITAQTLDGRPWDRLTVNLPDDELEPGEIFVKTWDRDGDVNLPAAALATGLFVDTGKRVPTGYVEASVWRIKA